MKCCEEMKLVVAWDNCESHAFNIYMCEVCGKIIKERISEKKGMLEISKENLIKYKECK